jgi:uncharacterized protein (PEP-CTERM system associated)
MKKANSKIAGLGRVKHKAIGATLMLAMTTPVLAADWKLAADITGGETYTDNVNLAPSGAQQSDLITTITPSISATKNGARFKADVHYALQNLFYARDSARNTTYHQLNAHANAELYEKEFYLDTLATITQAAISPLGASGVDNSNATGNLSSVRAFTLSPYWTHRFGSSATANARYSLSDVRNSNDAFSSSTNNSLVLSLASGSAFGRLSWELNHSEQHLNYTNRQDVSFISDYASLGYQINTRMRLTGALGVEKNNYLTTGAPPEGSFWNIDGAWTPSRRTSINLGFGHHYYGNTWNMAFKSRGAYSEWLANYNESVTTSNSQYGKTVDTTLKQDTVFLNSSGTGISLPSGYTVSDPTQIQSNQVFLNKQFVTGFNWKKGKSGITLRAYHSVQEALESGQVSSLLNSGAFQTTNTIKQTGVNAGWTWQLTPLMSSLLAVDLNRATYPDLGRTDHTTALQLGINRKFSRKLNGNVTLRRQVRTSNQNANEYSENALTGSVTYKF